MVTNEWCGDDLSAEASAASLLGAWDYRPCSSSSHRCLDDLYTDTRDSSHLPQKGLAALGFSFADRRFGVECIVV